MQQNEYHIEAGEYHVLFQDELQDDDILEEGYLEKKKSGKTRQAYGEMFQDVKTEWMGWEKQLIQNTTKTSVDAPQESDFG